RGRRAMTTGLDIIRDDLREIARRAEEDLRRLDGKRVLVTGGAGFLMSYLVDVLAARADAARVVVIDNFATAGRDRLSHLASHPGVELRDRDVSTLELAESF